MPGDLFYEVNLVYEFLLTLVTGMVTTITAEPLFLIPIAVGLIFVIVSLFKRLKG